MEEFEWVVIDRTSSTLKEHFFGTNFNPKGALILG